MKNIHWWGLVFIAIGIALVEDRVEDAVGFTAELGCVFKSGVVSELLSVFHPRVQTKNLASLARTKL